GEVLGVGEVALGALTILLDLHPVAVILPVLGKQDEGCGVRGLQREHEREGDEPVVGAVELKAVGGEGVPAHPREHERTQPEQEPRGAHAACDRLGEPSEAVAARRAEAEGRADALWCIQAGLVTACHASSSFHSYGSGWLRCRCSRVRGALPWYFASHPAGGS